MQQGNNNIAEDHFAEDLYISLTLLTFLCYS